MQKEIKLVTPHKLKSKPVEKEDLEKIFDLSEGMCLFFHKKIGYYSGHYAIAHPQVDNEKPLRFFVLNTQAEAMKEFAERGESVIINPVILRHSNYTIKKKEGCMSFANMPMKEVDRWQKCEVDYNVLGFDDNKNPIMSKRVKRQLTGLQAEIFQHEIDHLDAKYIYEVL